MFIFCHSSRTCFYACTIYTYTYCCDCAQEHKATHTNTPECASFVDLPANTRSNETLRRLTVYCATVIFDSVVVSFLVFACNKSDSTQTLALSFTSCLGCGPHRCPWQTAGQAAKPGAAVRPAAQGSCKSITPGVRRAVHHSIRPLGRHTRTRQTEAVLG